MSDISGHVTHNTSYLEIDAHPNHAQMIDDLATFTLRGRARPELQGVELIFYWDRQGDRLAHCTAIRFNHWMARLLIRLILMIPTRLRFGLLAPD